MTHLSADEIRTWFEQGRAADRERVIGHLAECAECRRALAALATATEAAEGPAPALTVAEAVPRGYAVRKPPAAARPWGGWLRPAYGLAGAAIVVLAVVWLTSPDRGGPDHAIRSTEVVALRPAGTASASEFRWESPFDAAKYRITVRDANGVLIHSADAPGSPLAIDRPLRERLTAGESYTWQVSALDQSGETIAESKPVTFRYQP